MSLKTPEPIQRMALSLAMELGRENHVIISGMARGIDAAAHEASLDTGTIAVFSGGVDVNYPAENRQLAEKLLKQGLKRFHVLLRPISLPLAALEREFDHIFDSMLRGFALILSEQAMGLQPQARHFPVRNRVVSGLARAVVVVEAAAKSGSLITAKNALDQGRDVLAVPGHPFDTRAAGCNLLIRDGARMVRKVADIIEELPPAPIPQTELPLDPPTPAKRSLKETAHLHQTILKKLAPSPIAEDQLIQDLKATARDVSPALTTLELHGKILRRAGGLLSRT